MAGVYLLFDRIMICLDLIRGLLSDTELTEDIGQQVIGSDLPVISPK